jgi:putative addiction module component (TIGR02574 family)
MLAHFGGAAELRAAWRHQCHGAGLTGAGSGVRRSLRVSPGGDRDVDASGHGGYDQPLMPEAQSADPLTPEARSAERLQPETRSAERLQPETEDAYRARVIAKIERGLADVEAGRVVPHAEVMAQLEARYGVRSDDAAEVDGTLDGSGERTRGGAAADRATLTDVTDTVSRILDVALQLPDAERAELAAILTDSIGDGSSPEEIEASWIAEAKRRLAAYRRGESTPIDLEDAMRELESKPRRGRDRRASAG